MDNITIDSSSFSEQLGIYDFFNVILSGTTFIGGLCIINVNLYNYIGNSFSLQKGIGLFLVIYILGMILQEIASILDSKIFNIYKGMNQSILKGKLDKEYEEETTNRIIKNPIVLEQYRKTADTLLINFPFSADEDRFEKKHVNGYLFSTYQYYVSVFGKDKKVEKLRALFAMSKNLMASFLLLAAIALLSTFTNTPASVNIFNMVGISYLQCTCCPNKIVISGFFAIMSVLFLSRAKRTMKNFLLILFGTYDILARFAENTDSECNKKKEDLPEKK